MTQLVGASPIGTSNWKETSNATHHPSCKPSKRSISQCPQANQARCQDDSGRFVTPTTHFESCQIRSSKFESVSDAANHGRVCLGSENLDDEQTAFTSPQARQGSWCAVHGKMPWSRGCSIIIQHSLMGREEWERGSFDNLICARGPVCRCW